MLRNNLQKVIDVLKQHNHAINVVYDIGANQGKWTSRYEKIMPNAKFFMFEANQRRKKPAAVNKHTWFNSVLSSPDINEVMFYDRMGTGDSYYKEDTTFYDGIMPVKLKTITLDEMVEADNIPMPQIMKLDTQGSEIDILSGATKALSAADVVQIETPILSYNEGAPGFLDYISFMIEHGFLPIGVDEVHLNDNILMQLDVVFMKKELKEQYYGSAGFWRGLGK